MLERTKDDRRARVREGKKQTDQQRNDRPKQDFALVNGALDRADQTARAIPAYGFPAELRGQPEPPRRTERQGKRKFRAPGICGEARAAPAGAQAGPGAKKRSRKSDEKEQARSARKLRRLRKRQQQRQSSGNGCLKGMREGREWTSAGERENKRSGKDMGKEKYKGQRGKEEKKKGGGGGEKKEKSAEAGLSVRHQAAERIQTCPKTKPLGVKISIFRNKAINLSKIWRSCP